jgi:hypothetical protein
MSPGRPSTPVRAALVAGALLAVAVGGYLFLIAPNRSAAAELDEQIQNTQSEIDARRAASRTERAPAVDVRDLFRLTRAMPDEARVPEVILELNRLAARSGVSFESISPKEPVASGAYRTLPIALVADGRYFGVTQFLGRIRKLVRVDGDKVTARGRLLAVESVSFGEGERPFPHVKATLTVNAFVYGGGAPATDAQEGATDAQEGATATEPPSSTGTETNPLGEGS